MRHRLALTLATFALITTACVDAATVASTPQFDNPVEQGIAVYNLVCVGCHGPEGVGVEGLGKPWVDSVFINSRTDQEMLDFLIEGRMSDHPDNTTGIAMMPRGGNPNITDEELLALIAYMRTLNLDT